MSDIKYVGQMSSSQNSRVIDPEGISYAVTNGHKDGEPKIIEPIACAMRGRNPENPSERARSNGKYQQRIEMGSNISNTITSVQKDNLLAEPMVMQVGNIVDDSNIGFKNPQRGRVYSSDGCSPCLNGIGNGGNLEPKIAEPLYIPQATKQGYIEVPPGSVFDASYPDSKTRRGRVQEGGSVSPTLMAGGEASCYYEGVSVHPNSHALEFKGEQSIKQDAAPALRATDYKAPHCAWEKVVFKGRQVEEGDGLYLNNSPKFDRGGLSGISRTLKSESHDAGVVTNYRIRKLTPRECFRLMGVSETNIDKIQQSGISNSQQYKMAGNSIVVDVLEHIFRKMFVDTHQESQQLSLF